MPALANIGLLATCKPGGGQAALHPIEDAAVCWEGEHLTWVGPRRDLPAQLAANALDAGGRLVVPGLIDCHTHLGFAGDRTHEFVRRVRGESYLDIARGGGGICATVRDTRAATTDALMARALTVLGEMATLGVTTIEAKSGYGLTLADEIKLLEMYRGLSSLQPLQIVATLLAAHTIPT